MKKKEKGGASQQKGQLVTFRYLAALIGQGAVCDTGTEGWSYSKGGPIPRHAQHRSSTLVWQTNQRRTPTAVRNYLKKGDF